MDNERLAKPRNKLYADLCSNTFRQVNFLMANLPCIAFFSKFE